MKRTHETASPAVGLRPEEIQHLRRLLLARKAELMDSYLNLEGDARAKGKEAGELSAVPYHPADLGTDSFETSLSLALLENDSRALRKVDEALERIDLGTYGTCEECARLIGRDRLKALPEATLCYSCKSREEFGRR